MNRARLIALIRKETRQMLRDRSNLIVGLALPVVLVLLFGYGLSFDVRNARVAVVLEDSSPAARQAVAGLTGSPWLTPAFVPAMAEAEAMIRAGAADAILRVPNDFPRRLAAGDGQLQLLINSIDSTAATAIETYVTGALASEAYKQVDRAGNRPSGRASITIVPRLWFNEANNSTWHLVPGVIALIMTLIGAFLTSLLVAREWERGTLEALFVTPVRPLELVLSKLAPYVLIGAIDLGMCLLAAHFLFHVPIRGSLWIIAAVSLLYLVVSLALGLLISGLTRNQFAASQVALLASFMPALMLSGFVFDLRNVPGPVWLVSQLVPATHFMGMIKTLFMAGDQWPIIWRDGAILLLYAVVLIALTQRSLKKRLG